MNHTVTFPAALWRKVFTSTYSNIGRLAWLASCRDPKSGRYVYDPLSVECGSAEAHNLLQIAHEFVWEAWLIGSLEQHRLDLALYLYADKVDSTRLSTCLSSSRFSLTLPPASASAQQRVEFATTLNSVWPTLGYRCKSNHKEPACENPTIQTNFEVALLAAIHHGYRDKELTLKSLSASNGIPVDRLGRQFKKLTGLTFHSYLRVLRIEHSARLLCESNWSVKEIADLVGYVDRSRFCEDFRQLKGCRPREFRARFSDTPGAYLAKYESSRPDTEFAYRNSDLAY